jgi:UDP-N-acetylglucosamine--N-acetylmuramyl-(pentapeptide) pyrophosphoryl-undecaprenol N-acetylglucosamine transferase
MTNTHHIVFAGAGTGGHFHPGLAVAAHLVDRLPEARITFVGTGKASERQTIRTAGYHYASLPSQPAPQNPLGAVRFITDNVAGYLAARWFLKEQDVSLAVGLGSHAGAATLRAAAARGIPTILLEQNAMPCRTACWLARSAAAVCIGFEHARPFFPMQVPLVITGNPARPAFERLFHRVEAGPPVDGPRPDDAQREKQLVVIGGAGGARSLNQYMPGALAQLGDRLRGWRVVHQTGEGQLQQTEARYCRAGVDALVVSYIDEMAPVMFDSDLIVCRAGGTMLAELALAGVPAILVPDPMAVGANQMANAQIILAGGACTVIDETSLDGRLDQALASDLRRLIDHEPRRLEMAANMRRLANPDAASRITDVVCDVLGGGLIQLAA